MTVDDPRLMDVITMADLRALLTDAMQVSGVYARVLDTNCAELPDTGASPWLPRLCQLIHVGAGDAACRGCAVHAAFQTAGHGRVQVYQCSAGLTSVALALQAGAVYLGTLLMGPALCTPLTPGLEEQWAAQTGVTQKDLAAAARALPLITEAQLEAGARLLGAALVARAETSLRERAMRDMRQRLETLIHEFCGLRSSPPVLSGPEQQVVDAWEAGSAAALLPAVHQLTEALALEWSQRPGAVRLRLLDLLIALVQHSTRAGGPGEVRDALIPFATGVLSLRAWRPVEVLVTDLGRELCRFLSLPEARPTDSRIDRAVRHLHANFQSDLSLQGMARGVGLSPQYFCYLFKEQTGCSFVQYLRRVRLEHARELLRKSTLEVTEVAFESGFNDVTHFGQTFKAAEGVTPSQYRRQGAWVRHLPPASPARAIAVLRAPPSDGP